VAARLAFVPLGQVGSAAPATLTAQAEGDNLSLIQKLVRRARVIRWIMLVAVARKEHRMSMTGDEYLESLRDGRKVVFRGELVDVTTHPRFASVHSIARGYDEALKHIGDEPANAKRAFPQSTEELRHEMDLMGGLEDTVKVTRLALLGLHTAAGRMAAKYPQYGRRIEDFVAYCDENDLRVVPAITDAKGSRAVGPLNQEDADSYVRIVDQNDDGIFISGAKLHVTNAAVVHELLVMPTKQMKAGEEQWAVACAVAANSEGVLILNAVPGSETDDSAYYPHSSIAQFPYGFIVFDKVFVPWARVFLAGETKPTGAFAHSLGLWLRLDTSAVQSNESDMLVGLAQLLAEANGAEKIPHIRDKIAELILDATVVRAGFEAALATAKLTEDGFASPDELYTNMAKYFATVNMPKAYAIVQDIAGALIITAPMPEDLESPLTSDYIDKYLRASTKLSGLDRTRLFHAARDIAADAAASNRQVTYMHGGGGLYAQRLVARRHYNMDRAKRLALEAAGLDGTPFGVQQVES
jgi:4-hydroxybutyryl-CoA dehydratase/vinylacetyl-CoA-Delta-isomerase